MARMHSLTRRSVLALLCTAGVFLWLPTTALAADLRQGANVTVGAGQTVSDDIYAAGGTITVAGTINGSLIAAGATITVSGNVSRDLIIAGGTINVTGKVGGSIRAAGGNLTLNGPVEQDVVITGGMIAIGSGATIGRDLVLAGGRARNHPHNTIALGHQPGRLGLHREVKGWVAAPGLAEEIEEIPLRHQSDEFAAGRQMAEIGNRHIGVADDADFSEALDFGEEPVGLAARESHQRGVHVDVLDARAFGVEARAEFK